MYYFQRTPKALKDKKYFGSLTANLFKDELIDIFQKVYLYKNGFNDEQYDTH